MDDINSVYIDSKGFDSIISNLENSSITSYVREDERKSEIESRGKNNTDLGVFVEFYTMFDKINDLMSKEFNDLLKNDIENLKKMKNQLLDIDAETSLQLLQFEFNEKYQNVPGPQMGGFSGNNGNSSTGKYDPLSGSHNNYDFFNNSSNNNVDYHNITFDQSDD